MSWGGTMNIKSYRKKPVVIQAIQYTGDNMNDIVLFLGVHDVPENIVQELTIETLEGAMVVSRGDFVIRGIKGECYPCKPDIFAATYEEVLEP